VKRGEMLCPRWDTTTTMTMTIATVQAPNGRREMDASIESLGAPSVEQPASGLA